MSSPEVESCPVSSARAVLGTTHQAVQGEAWFEFSLAGEGPGNHPRVTTDGSLKILHRFTGPPARCSPAGPSGRRKCPHFAERHGPCVILMNGVSSHRSLLWAGGPGGPFLELGLRAHPALSSRLCLLANFNKNYLCPFLGAAATKDRKLRT